jgi:hypothetical protein
MAARKTRWTKGFLAPWLSCSSPVDYDWRRRARPRLELLEDRWLPANITPTTFADGVGIGSLRDAVLTANTDATNTSDTIVLSAGTYALTVLNTAGHETAGLQGDLNINPTGTVTSVTIKGTGTSGPNATIIDASAVHDRVFQIVNSGLTVIFQNVVLQGGMAQDDGTNGALPGTTNAEGGAILNNGSTVQLNTVVIQSNAAVAGAGANGSAGVAGGTGFNASGGGILTNGGSITATSSFIDGNSAIGGAGGSGGAGTMPGGAGGAGGAAGIALGGGVAAAGNATIMLTDTAVDGNTLQGGAGGAGGLGGPGGPIGGDGGKGGFAGLVQGGGLWAQGGSVTIVGANIAASLSNNTLQGGAGGFGANGGNGLASGGIGGKGGNAGNTLGGGIYSSGATLNITNANLSLNTLVGGVGGNSGSGGNGVSSHAGSGGSPAGSGGNTQGGGLYVTGGTANIMGSTLTANTLTAGLGGNGGVGGTDTLTGGAGGGGGSGGNSQGAGLYFTVGTATLTNTTISTNSLAAGNGGAGGAGGAGGTGSSGFGGPGGNGGNGGSPQGGGIFVGTGTLDTINTTVASNTATSSTGGPGGKGGVPSGTSGHAGTNGTSTGGGLFTATGTINATNALFGGNIAAASPDFSGAVTASSSLFQNATGATITAGGNGPNITGQNPLLGPLQDNGGLTGTRALGTGSPAIDAGTSVGAPGTDQRGVPRSIPTDTVYDIGAYELNTTTPSSTITFPANGAQYNVAGWTGTITGTASDSLGGGIQRVQVSIQEVGTGLFWNGTAFANATAVFFVASGTTSWSLPFAESNFPAADSYTVNSQARNNAGNFESPGPSNTFTIDNDLPTVAMSSTVSNPTNANPIPVTATFGEAVTGFTMSSQVTPTNATVSNFVAVSATTYTFDLTPTLPPTGGVVSADIAAGVAVDAAGNPNQAAPTFSVNYDADQPTVALSSSASNPTGTTPIPMTTTFSESVSGFALSGITVTNGTASALAGSGSSYTFNVTPSGPGAVTVVVNANAAQDPAGNNNQASPTFSITYDDDGTTVSATLTSSASNPTGTSPIPMTATFGEAVTGFSLSGITVTNGTASALSGSGSVYTFNVTPTGPGAVTVVINANAAQDDAGIGNQVSPTFSITYDDDGTTVSATLSSSLSNETNQSPIPMTATFGESVTGFSLSGITVTNGTASNLVGSGTTYTFNVTPSGLGLVTVVINANAAQDDAGIGNQVSPTFSITFDNDHPTVALSSSASNPTGSSPIPMTATFGEVVSGFTLSGITVTNGTASNLAGTGTTYTFDVTPTGPGPVSVLVKAGAAQDPAGNNNQASSIFSITYDDDGTIVSATLSSSASNPTGTSPIPMTATFGEAVTGFSLSGITVTNGTASALAGSGTTYTFNVTPTGPGAVTVVIKANAAQDDAGIGNQVSPTFSITYDDDGLTVSATLSSSVSNPTNVSPIPMTATFGEAVTGFSLSGITVTNGIASALAGSGTTYTFNVTPSGQGVVTVVINANAAQDDAGIGNQVSPTFSVTFDNVQPTVALSSSASDPTGTTPIPMTATFSESVSGLTLSGITVTNGTASNLAGSGTSYTFNVTPAGPGPVSVVINAGAAQDDAGNNNKVSPTFSIIFDNDGLTVSAALTSSAVDPTNQSPIPMTATFGEAVTGLTLSGITVTNGTASGLAGSGTTYTFNVTPTGPGPVTVVINAGAAQDDAGVGNQVSPTFSITFDNVAPSVSLSSTASNPTNVSPIPITATFSEAVSGFSLAGITVTNGTASNLTGSGASYTFDVTPSGLGPVSVVVNAGAAQDDAKNNNTASSVFNITFDNDQPTVALSSSASSATNVSPIAMTATFGEPVSGFSLAGITVTNGTASNLSGSGTTYTFDVTPSGLGVVTVVINAGAAQDDATNNNQASSVFSITFDNDQPTVSLSSSAANPTNQSPLPMTATFSEAVSGFTLAGINVTNGTASNLTGSGTSYTFNVTPTGAGPVTVVVNAGAARDDANNNNQASGAFSLIFDNVAPTVTVNLATGQPFTTGTSPILFTVVFSKPVTSFTAAEVTLGGTAGATTVVVSGSGPIYTLSVSGMARGGTVTASIAAGVVHDVAGNANLASTSTNNTANFQIITLLVTGVGPGGGPEVKAYDARTMTLKFDFMAYDPSFRGGVRVATADVDGDGDSDIITGAGPGGAPEVRVFDGTTGTLILDFMAFNPGFNGGIFVAAGEFDGDNHADIVVGADAGGGPEVAIFSGVDGHLINAFFAYSPFFTGGVRVAVGDVDGDGDSDLITGAGPGGGPHVKVFDGITFAVLQSYFAYNPGFTGGIFVGAGDLNGDGHADVITGAGTGGGPNVKVFSGVDISVLQSFMAFNPNFTGGVQVAFIADVNADGRGEIVAGAGPGGGPQAEIFEGINLAVLDSFFAVTPAFRGGLYVGGQTS